MSGSLLTNCADTMGPVTPPTHQAPLQQFTRSLEPRFDSIETATALVTVVAADVDPLRSIGRPGSAPTAIVGGVGERCADERKAMEAVMEAVAMEREA